MIRFVLAASCLTLLAACAPVMGLPVAVVTAPLPLDPAHPALESVGRLRFMGAVSLASPAADFGSFSSLRWTRGRLLSVADTGWWFTLAPREVRGRLVGVTTARHGPLLDRGGALFPTKDAGDAESLTRSAHGGWLVGFEQAHRVWRYPRIDRAPRETGIDPVALMGPMEKNHGVEAMAGDERGLFLCEEIASAGGRPNCLDGNRRLAIVPPAPIDALGGQPSDADRLDGRTFVLFRSYSPGDGQGAAIVMIERDGAVRPLAALRPPLTLENTEGLAARRGPRGATWLYLITDNDNDPKRRLMLMKFELKG